MQALLYIGKLLNYNRHYYIIVIQYYDDFFQSNFCATEVTFQERRFPLKGSDLYLPCRVACLRRWRVKLPAAEQAVGKAGEETRTVLNT